MDCIMYGATIKKTEDNMTPKVNYSYYCHLPGRMIEIAFFLENYIGNED